MPLVINVLTVLSFDNSISLVVTSHCLGSNWSFHIIIFYYYWAREQHANKVLLQYKYTKTIITSVYEMHASQPNQRTRKLMILKRGGDVQNNKPILLKRSSIEIRCKDFKLCSSLFTQFKSSRSSQGRALLNFLLWLIDLFV